jgi:hypothetical protein
VEGVVFEGWKALLCATAMLKTLFAGALLAASAASAYYLYPEEGAGQENPGTMAEPIPEAVPEVGEDEVLFQCIKRAGKLRVRIISDGFFHEANCQFPRAIRREGAFYSAPRAQVRFRQGPNRRHYYSVHKKYVTCWKTVEDGAEDAGEDAQVSAITAAMERMKVFEDEGESECVVCMDADKDVRLFLKAVVSLAHPCRLCLCHVATTACVHPAEAR